MSESQENGTTSLLYVDALRIGSGGQAHAEGSIDALRALGVEVRRFRLFPDPPSAPRVMRERPLLSAVRPFLRDLLQVLRDRSAERKLLAEIALHRPDALLVRDAPMLATPRRVCRRLKLPYFLEVNAPLAYETDRHYGSGLAAIAVARERANWENAAHVFCVSEVLRDYLLEHSSLRASRVSVVPNGCDLARFQGADAVGAELRERLGFPPCPDARLFCFAGTLQPWHGTAELVAAMAELPASCGLLVIGGGAQHERIAHLVRSRGLTNRVRMVGRIEHEQMPAHLAACDAAIMPYPRQALFYFSPLKMFEYLAAGLPIVASKQGQIAQLLTDGINGLLYPSEPAGQHRALAEALQRFLQSSSTASMKDANRQLAASYTWSANAKRILDTIRSELAVQPGPV